MKRNIFITGATGNIGAGLACRILSDYPFDKVILLIRADSDCQARERFRQTVAALYPNFDNRHLYTRAEFLHGDITVENLGLSGECYDRLINRVSHIIHSAACTKFDPDLALALKTNFQGTGNIIRLAQNIKKRGKRVKLAHISTAFVCGSREGIIYEDSLDEHAECANSYEYTKMIAESYVRRNTHGIPTVVFRPSIVVGDSHTGKIPRFNVLYTPLKYICMRLIDGLPCDPNTRLDIVPLDFVCESIARIFLDLKNDDMRTYQVAAGRDNRPTIGEIVDKTVSIYNSFQSRNNVTALRYYNSENDSALNNNPARIRRIINSYRPYIGYDRLFDTANFEHALCTLKLRPPDYRNYLETILRHFIDSALPRTRTRVACSEML